jgi:hypothetical protein
VTWWNLYSNSKPSLALPPCNYGPQLFFAGNWASASGRRLLAEEGGAASEAAPAPAPEAAPAADAAQAAAPAAAEAEGGSGGSDRIDALGLMSVCASMKWRVEDVDNGKRLWPADLYSAMVTARKEGRVFFR